MFDKLYTMHIICIRIIRTQIFKLIIYRDIVMKKLLTSIVILMACTFSTNSIADKHAKKHADYMPSLITATPLEGRMLAMTIARKTIGTIQSNKEAKHRVRKIYAEDPMMLMRAAELVNLEFRIIAEANNYWRK